MKDGRYINLNRTQTHKLQKRCRNKKLEVYRDDEHDNWVIYLGSNILMEFVTGKKLDFGIIQRNLSRSYLRDQKEKVRKSNIEKDRYFDEERENLSKDLSSDLYDYCPRENGQTQKKSFLMEGKK